MSWLTKWRTEHPTAFKRVVFILIGAGVAVFLMGWWKLVHAQTTATLECPGGPPTWNQTALKLTCPASTGGGPVQPPVTPPVVTGCPAGSLIIPNQYGKLTIPTAEFGPFKNNIVAVQIKVPQSATGTKLRTSGWVEFQSGPTQRYAAFKLQPCDFSKANALKNANSGAMIVSGVNSFSFVWRIGTPGAYSAGLAPGSTYWINIKNTYSDGVQYSCQTENCDMRGSFAD